MRSISKCDTLLDKGKYTLMHKDTPVMDLTVDKATDDIQRIDVWRALARGCSYPSWHSRSGRFQRVIGRSLHSRLASDETQKKDNQLLYSKPKVLFFILFWERMDTFALLSRHESFSGNVKYSKGGNAICVQKQRKRRNFITSCLLI